MASEPNLTGAEVVALTERYMNERDIILVKKALVYATNAHKEQYRQSGEPYIIHPIQVASILAKLKLDAVTVACGFLHDVVEDTETTLDDLEAEFGPEVRIYIIQGIILVHKKNKQKNKGHSDSSNDKYGEYTYDLKGMDVIRVS